MGTELGRRVLAWFCGDDGDCPACSGQLVSLESGHHQCRICGVAVDFARGRWCYKRGTDFHRLPGLLGRPYDRERQGAA